MNQEDWPESDSLDNQGRALIKFHLEFGGGVGGERRKAFNLNRLTLVITQPSNLGPGTEAMKQKGESWQLEAKHTPPPSF